MAPRWSLLGGSPGRSSSNEPSTGCPYAGSESSSRIRWTVSSARLIGSWRSLDYSRSALTTTLSEHEFIERALDMRG